jgi:hypothetical protein
MSSDNGYGGPLGAFLGARALPRSTSSPEAADAFRGEVAPPRVARRPAWLRFTWRPRHLTWSWTR